MIQMNSFPSLQIKIASPQKTDIPSSFIAFINSMPFRILIIDILLLLKIL